jgi:molybdopterin-guanine dinucleotide biosynthesis protein A
VSIDAVVLAGGRARRFGGADKALIEIGGEPLLDRVVSALSDAERIVVVGPRRITPSGIVWVQEQPPGEGPVHALVAGLEHVGAEMVAVVAVDLPFVSRDAIRRLADAAQGRDGALVIDADGRDQMMLGVYRTDALRARLAELRQTSGASMKELIEGLDLERVEDAVSAFDCDTAADVLAAREKAGELGAESVDRRGV